MLLEMCQENQEIRRHADLSCPVLDLFEKEVWRDWTLIWTTDLKKKLIDCDKLAKLRIQTPTIHITHPFPSALLQISVNQRFLDLQLWLKGGILDS